MPEQQVKIIDYEIIYRWYYRKKDGTIVRPKNGKPFPIKVPIKVD